MFMASQKNNLSQFGSKKAKGTAVIRRKDGSKVFLRNGKVVAERTKSGVSVARITIRPSTKSSSGIKSSKPVSSQKQLSVSRNIQGLQNKVNVDMRGERNKARVVGTVNKKSGKLTSVRLQIDKVRTTPRKVVAPKPTKKKSFMSQVIADQMRKAGVSKNTVSNGFNKKTGFVTVKKKKKTLKKK